MTKCHCIEKVPHGTEDGGGEFSFTGQVQVRSQKPKHHLWLSGSISGAPWNTLV